MRVSYNEVYNLSKKLFEGLGFPYGADEDAAFMVAWLEHHGLDGLAQLQTALPGLSFAGGVTQVSQGPGSAVLDAGGASTLSAAPAAIDLATVLAQESGHGQVDLNHCRHPLFALPLAVKAIVRGLPLHLFWRESDKLYGFEANETAETLRVLTDDVFEDLEVETLRILCGEDIPSRYGLEGSSVQSLWTRQDLLKREINCLDQGISVDPEFWSCVVQLAGRVLVPATAESRRGAGGGDAND